MATNNALNTSVNSFLTDTTMAAASNTNVYTGLAVKTYVDNLTTVATQSDQETATSITTLVTPGRQQYHPSACKVWCAFTAVTSTTILGSYNVSSLTDGGSGITTVNFTTSFSSTNYACSATADRTGSIAVTSAAIASRATGNAQMATYNTVFTPTDSVGHFIAFGDQ